MHHPVMPLSPYHRRFLLGCLVRNRGQGSGISTGRGGSYASIPPRPGSGVGYRGSASYSVGPSTPSRIAKTTTAREAAPSHPRGWIDVTKTRWVDLDSAGAGTLGTHSVGPLNSVLRCCVL